MEPNSQRILLGAAGAGDRLPTVIGEFAQGGYFAGYISHTANGVPTHGLIVAPRATGATGTGYTLTTNLTWKTSQTDTPNTSSPFDGAANTAAMIAAGAAAHPAAQFCNNLTINGYSDWYLPARYELEIAYYNLKPTTLSNSTSWGTNIYSVPRRNSNYNISTPAQTSVAAFQQGGSEAFVDREHWPSTQGINSSQAWVLNFDRGSQVSNSKISNACTRAFRKFAL